MLSWEYFMHPYLSFDDYNNMRVLYIWKNDYTQKAFTELCDGLLPSQVRST